MSKSNRMEMLEWDAEIKDEQTIPTDPYSRLYKWYADILNHTSDLVKSHLHRDINQIDCNGRTALHYACNRGHLPVVQLLLSAGCNVDQASSDGVTALHLACRNGHVDIVKVLLEAGASINHITHYKQTPLFSAAAGGHVGVLESLIKAGADVNASDFLDRTALSEAIKGRNTRAVELLVKNGSRINIENGHGLTPLYEAVMVRSFSIVEILINAGAKLTQSHCLLHFAVSSDDCEIASLLIQVGSVVNLRDQDGNTPLIIAAKNGHYQAARFLLNNGAMVNLPNSVNGISPVFAAADTIEDRNVDTFRTMLELLVSRGAALDQDTFLDTPLYRALLNEKTNIAQALISFGADVNFFDPFILLDHMKTAVKNNDLTVVKMLVYAGYNLSNITARGHPYNESIEWIQFMKRNPMSLMSRCRLAIRKHLGKNVYRKINQLGLPSQLTKFLHLEYVQ